VTDLERFATALLAQWRADNGTGGGPIGVDAALDHVLPYRTARRLLGIDNSEDYEATFLRLIAGEEGLVVTSPAEAAEMARTTMSSKLPDLDVLRLLRSASVTLPDEVVARLGDAPFGGARAEADAKWNRARPGDGAPTDGAAEESGVVIPLPTAADHTRVAPTDQPPGPPPAYLTAQVEFIPPAQACWSCGDELPHDRAVKFCPFCGADQRPPTCGECGTAVERHWNHCPECGRKLKE
jgi:RNA polymerase subunit RPABC4/transcription elongation factor Spt4